MIPQEFGDIPDWLKMLGTLIAGAGGARLLAVWLESRRLEKNEYRDTLIARIKMLEATMESMQQAFIKISVELALVKKENSDLRLVEELRNAKPPGPV